MKEDEPMKNENTSMENPQMTILKLEEEMRLMGQDNMVLAAYAARHLREDIKAGMDIGIRDLRILLDAVGKYVDEEALSVT